VFHTIDKATYGQRLGFWRHLPAIAFDLATVAWPTTVAMVTLHERFTILPTTDGSPRFSPIEQARINEIDQVFNRGIRVGDAIFTLSGSGWWLTMLVLVVMTITVFIAVPAVLGQRTIGQLLVGMARTPAPDRLAPAITAAAQIDLSDPAFSDEYDGVAPAPTLAAPMPLDLDMIHLDSSAGDATGYDDKTAGDAADNTDDSTEPAVEIDAVDIDAVDTNAVDIDAGDADIDVTDGARWAQVTLADEADYLRWDREFGETAAEPAAGSTMVQTAPVTAPQAPASPQTAATAERPEWSDDWDAWMFWDVATRRWYKHDTDDNRWVPVS
jgi:hypothetical protein